MIASLRRLTAACSAVDTSVIVRDTSVVVSMARSAIPGCKGSGASIFTFCNSLGRCAYAEHAPDLPTIRGREICSRKLPPC